MAHNARGCLRGCYPPIATSSYCPEKCTSHNNQIINRKARSWKTTGTHLGGQSGGGVWSLDVITAETWHILRCNARRQYMLALRLSRSFLTLQSSIIHNIMYITKSVDHWASNANIICHRVICDQFHIVVFAHYAYWIIHFKLSIMPMI